MRALRTCLAAGFALLLATSSLAARPAQAVLPTRNGEPVLWGTFITCVNFMEKWVGPQVPDWVVHSSVISYPARRPLYDDLGRPLLDDQGRQRCTTSLQSGRVFFPPAWRVADPARMPIVIYNHGTTLLKDGVASEFGGHEWIFGAAAAAYYGFAVAMPDQPGMGGDGTTYHPFCQAKALAYAVVDGIPAIQERFQGDPFVARNRYAWDGRIFLMGYSEGGYAALAAAREMETHKEAYGGDRGFWLAGTASMAGPYDISGTMRRQILDPVTPFDHPFFIPYILFGYNAIYGKVLDPLDALAPELLKTGEDGSIQEWCNGTQDGPVVDGLIAGRLGVAPGAVVLRQEFNPVWVARELEEPGFQTSPIKGILTENDVARGWAPTKPILFCQSPDDTDVLLENTLVARGTLAEAIRKEGREPEGILNYAPLGQPGCGISHVGGIFLAIPMAFDWIYRGAGAE